jgi:hypothetical protein
MKRRSLGRHLLSVAKLFELDGFSRFGHRPPAWLSGHDVEPFVAGEDCPFL